MSRPIGNISFEFSPLLAPSDVGLGLVCQCIVEASQLGGLVHLLMSHICGVG
jgi:hypothetical protein